MGKNNFAEKVYDLVEKIPAGKVTTYKRLGELMSIRAYRAIGQVLARNPYVHEVPCHRVVRSDGGVGGFFGKKDLAASNEKARLLAEEGIEIEEGRVNLEEYMFSFE